MVAVEKWLAARGSRTVAEQWVQGLMKALRSLEEMPERCPEAPESAEFEAPIRHLILGSFRVLFIVRHRVVYVLHVRHAHRRIATLQDLKRAIQEARGLGGPT